MKYSTESSDSSRAEGVSSRGMGGRVGWVDGWDGLITSFNVHISHVKRIQNEARGTSPRLFQKKFSVHQVFATQKINKRASVYWSLLPFSPCFGAHCEERNISSAQRPSKPPTLSSRACVYNPLSTASLCISNHVIEFVSVPVPAKTPTTLSPSDASIHTQDPH